MVLITIVMGVYKPTYNWGAPHCRGIFQDLPQCCRTEFCCVNSTVMLLISAWGTWHVLSFCGSLMIFWKGELCITGWWFGTFFWNIVNIGYCNHKYMVNIWKYMVSIWNFMNLHILGMSSSQLTNSIIFQRGRLKPPTR